ncbi:hypothetical protein V6Z11_1Z032100 [Gossypium hirsutum]
MVARREEQVLKTWRCGGRTRAVHWQRRHERRSSC